MLRTLMRENFVPDWRPSGTALKWGFERSNVKDDEKKCGFLDPKYGRSKRNCANRQLYCDVRSHIGILVGAADWVPGDESSGLLELHEPALERVSLRESRQTRMIVSGKRRNDAGDLAVIAPGEPLENPVQSERRPVSILGD
jgi:hypothetical protein